MKKDEIFFGISGLTMTSASYICNLAKETYMQIEKELNNIRFYDKDMQLIGTSGRQLISEGTKDISDIIDKNDRIAKLKSLIAWLREALKAKDRLFNEAENMSYNDFGLEVPEQPERPVYLTEDDVISIWNIKQRNRYFYLETMCAQIGKYIHPDGVFSKERSYMYDIIHTPRIVNGSGRDAIVYTYTPSIDSSEVEDKFMEMQGLHRSYQAELNSMKHEIETTLENDKKEKDFNFQHEYLVWSNKMVDINNQLKVLKNEKLSELQKLKIIIPDSLESIYKEISALGKK
jgi:hypothetical protein